MGRCLFTFICSSLIFLLALTLPSIVLAENLVSNSDFETFDQSNFTGWSKNYSTLSLSQEIESALVHSGSFSAKLKSTSNSSKYLYQTIASVEGTIKLSAWVKNISGDNFTSFVRISWYSTVDGTGSEITSSDSQAISQKGEWQNISVSTKKPDAAKSMKAKLIVDPSSASEVSAIFDEVTLEHVVPLSFSLSVSEKVAIGDEFETKVTIQGLSQQTKYYIKLLGGEKGKDISELYRVQTFSTTKNSFLSWNATWTDFPNFVTNSSGEASTSLKAKFNDDTIVGDNILAVRIRKDGDTTNLDSGSVGITLTAKVVVAETKEEDTEPANTSNTNVNLVTTTKNTTINTATKSAAILVPSKTSSQSPSIKAETNNVLGTSTANFKDNSVNSQASNDKIFPLEIVFIIPGAILIGIGGIFFLRQKGIKKFW